MIVVSSKFIGNNGPFPLLIYCALPIASPDLIECIYCLNDLFFVLKKKVGKDTSERVRPVKFTLSSSDQAHTILSKTKLLRHVEGFSSVYITPDRSAADRIAYKKVVDQLLNKRTAEPDKVHVIRNFRVVSSEKEP